MAAVRSSIVHVWVVGDEKDANLPSYIERMRQHEGVASVGVGMDAQSLVEWCTSQGIEGPDALLMWMGGRFGPALRQQWTNGPHLTHARWLHSLSAGLDHLLPFAAITDTALPVITNAKGVFGPSLGEWVLAGCLHFAKSLRALCDAQTTATWRPFIVQELKGATMTIIGYGGIGHEAAKRGVAFGMRVVALSRSHGNEEAKDALGVELRPLTRLDETLAESDYVVMATPLTAETKDMIGEAQFASMKKSAVFINVGRGACVDEPALIRALQQRTIAGAALDVFAVEPLPADSQLWQLDNVLISPHSADRTETYMQEACDLFFDNLDRFVKGEELLNIVDKTSGY